MKTIYLILFRHDTAWDGQSIRTTESKALFDFIEQNRYKDTSFEDMPEELQKEVLYLFADQDPFSVTISELIWELSKDNSEYTNIPVIIGGYTEFTSPM